MFPYLYKYNKVKSREHSEECLLVPFNIVVTSIVKGN